MNGKIDSPLIILGISFVVFIALAGTAAWLFEQSHTGQGAAIVPGQSIPLSQKMQTLQQLAASSNESASSTALGGAAASSSQQAGVPTPAQQQALDSVSQSSPQSQQTDAQKLQALQSLNSQ